MDEGGLTLERLDEIRLDRLLEHDRERACRAELLRGHRLALVRLADGDLPEPLAQIGEIARHRDHGHDLARRGDVEAGLARIAVRLAAEAGDDVTQRAVVHVQAAPPGDRDRIEAEEVPMHEVRVDQRREQVVRGRDRVQIAGEVEVQVLHRDDLRVAAAGSASLDAEDRPERGLAQAEHGLLAEDAEPLGQRHGGRGLPLPRRCRRDRRDVDQLRVRPVREPIQHREIDLCLVAPVRLDLLGRRAPGRRRRRGSGAASRSGRSRGWMASGSSSISLVSVP